MVSLPGLITLRRHMDTTLMFQDAVHLAVLEVVERMISGSGVRCLSELERKPIMRDFYRR